MSTRKGWSLVESDWKRLSDLAVDRPWHRTYLEKDYQSRVPKVSGVYLMCVEAPIGGKVFDRLYNSVYVGQAINLRNRFNDHLRGYGDVVFAKATFRRIDYWYTRAELAELSELEQCLIDALGPSANRGNALRARSGEPIFL